MLENKVNGLGVLSFNYRRYRTDSQVDWRVEYSINDGAGWTQIGSDFTAPASDDVVTFSETINITGNIRVRIKRATEDGAANKRLNIDDITLTDYNGTNTSLASIKNANLIVYPNPVIDNVHIQINSNIVKVEIFDAMGRVVVEVKNMAAVDKEMVLPISKLGVGVYLVKVTDETGKVFCAKFLKK
jgi:hypothetical protein